MSNIESPMVTSQIKEASDILVWLSLGVYFAETAHTFKRNISVFTRGEFRTWSNVVYFASRISLWVYLSTQIAVRLAEHQLSCQTAFTALQVVAALCILSCSSLLASSTVSSFTGPARRNLAIVLSLLGLLLAISWIAGVQDLKSHWEKNSGQGWQDGSCQLDRVSVSMPLKYALTSLFTLVLLGLSIYSNTAATSTFCFRKSTLYLSVLFCSSLVIFILSSLHLNPQLSSLLVTPFLTTYTLISSRFHFNHDITFNQGSGELKGATSQNQSQLTFESAKVENGCRSPTVIQMQDIPSMPAVMEEKDKDTSSDFVSESLNKDSDSDEVAEKSFNRSLSPTSSRSAIYLVGNLNFSEQNQPIEEPQREVVQSTPPRRTRIIPFNSSDSTFGFQDPWNQLTPSSILAPMPSSPAPSSHLTPSTSHHHVPLRSPIPNPTSQRSRPQSSKSKRPLTPRKNKDQSIQDERPSTANSFTQRLAIALESNSTNHLPTN